MFPHTEFLGLDLYLWMIFMGVLAGMAAGRLCSARAGVSAKVFNITVLSAAIGLILGYIFAVLTESFWEFLENGTFVWGTGATFYGGLIGGTMVFLAVYFLLGKLFCKDKEHIRELVKVLSLAAPCVALAHAFGRLGCLFEGCCYGQTTDAWYGIELLVDGTWQKRVPVQLFEAIFLFVLAVLMFLLIYRRKHFYNLSLYLILYGIWRFFIEFARADDRGISGMGALSPSQFLSIVLIAVGIAFALFYRFFLARRIQEAPHEGS